MVLRTEVVDVPGMDQPTVEIIVKETVEWGSRAVLQLDSGGRVRGWIPTDDRADDNPTMRIPTDVAHSMVSGLMKHFGVSVTSLPQPPAHTDCGNCEREQQRTDRLLEAVISMATTQPVKLTEVKGWGG